MCVLTVPAGGQLYHPHDTVLGAGTGALVLLAWIAVIGVAARARFTRRDA